MQLRTQLFAVKVLKKYIYKVELISCLTFRNSENYSFLVGNEKETNT